MECARAAMIITSVTKGTTNALTRSAFSKAVAHVDACRCQTCTNAKQLIPGQPNAA